MLRLVAAILVLLPLATGCAGAAGGMAPSASVTTAVQGWEQWLRVDWSAQERAPGQLIDGYVYAVNGAPIHDVRILAQALDAAGNVVSQKMIWLPGALPSLDRAYFSVGAMPAADRYRVTVWSFDTVQSPSYQ